MAWRRRPEKPCTIVARSIEVLGDLDPEECSSVCPTDALRFDAGRVVVEPGLCTVCLACMAICGPSRIRVVSDWVCPD
ncbi:hypothetical protein CF15_06630 [Pyrodictium occultum]|uniref:4Fe-4S ferredoxin-type domain-containing protein n=1 Tax=Pyrodictium occultum TaxID=2309 RepID=A0A0V8RWH9_PYROC|nr:hypothetical protein [Pyrodictium occultum]KSW12399.1 hypothetical protein CF15_06630 [Pyrodictium occultum]